MSETRPTRPLLLPRIPQTNSKTPRKLQVCSIPTPLGKFRQLSPCPSVAPKMSFNMSKGEVWMQYRSGGGGRGNPIWDMKCSLAVSWSVNGRESLQTWCVSRNRLGLWHMKRTVDFAREVWSNASQSGEKGRKLSDLQYRVVYTVKNCIKLGEKAELN